MLLVILLFVSSCSVPYGEYHMYQPSDLETKDHVSLYLHPNKRFFMKNNKFYTYGSYTWKNKEINMQADTLPFPRIIESYSGKNNKVVIRVTENGDCNSVCWLKDEGKSVVQQTNDNGVIEIKRPIKQTSYMCSCYIGDSINITISPEKNTSNYFQINLSNDSIKKFITISPMKIRVNNDTLVVVSGDIYNREKFVRFFKQH